MPTTSGTSVVGAQFLGFLPVAANRFLNIYIGSLDPSDRFERIGTVLVCFRLANDHLPTSYVAKLYGNGIAENLSTELPGVPLEVWIRWFDAGITWSCITPG